MPILAAILCQVQETKKTGKMKPLKAVWNLWKSLAEKISIVVNTALLAAVYAAVIAPTAITRKLFVKKKKETSYWKDFEQEDGIEAIRRQF